jgi:type VII secretion protein EccB
MYGGALHPVTNLASARLITDNPETPKVVKEAALEKHPRGALMGILSAPNNFSMRTDKEAVWTVCDQRSDSGELSLTKETALTTTLFAGEDALSGDVTAQPDDQAVLVRLPSQPDRLWIVYKGRKAEIGANDRATKSALGINTDTEKNAIPISQGLMDAINTAPALASPFIQERGVVNPLLTEANNGDVIVNRDSKGDRVFHAVLVGGVQEIPELLAQILENTGSKLIDSVDAQRLSELPRVSDIDVDRYPSRAPEFTTPYVMCWKWARGESDLTARSQVMVGEALPVKAEDRDKVLPLLKPTGSIVQANDSMMKPGKGWFVRVTGDAPESQAREQLLWIDDTGVRYFIGLGDDGKYDQTVNALGINTREPLLIPWSIAKLYAQGSTLSRSAALTMHVNVPANPNQQPVPDDKGGN